MDIELSEKGKLPELNDKAKKEIAYYVGNDAVVDGNDLLYYYCRMHPFHEMIADKRDATDEEREQDVRALADQLWLIGRAYAAPPDRYAYTGGSGKPKETHLDSEGYESFFRDIARTMLGVAPGGSEAPGAYFRGERVERERFDDLAFLDHRKELIAATEKASKALRCGIDMLRKRIDGSLEEGIVGLRNERLPKVERPITSDPQSKGGCEFRLDSGWDRRIGKTAELVVLFAGVLGNARKLRDIAIVIETAKRGESTCRKCSDDVSDWSQTLTDTDKEQYLSISFASKFLHFHYPQLFFIFDSISEKRARQTVEVRCKGVSSLSKWAEARIDAWPEDLGLASSGQVKKDGQDKGHKKLIEKLAEYRIHAARELAIAYALWCGSGEAHELFDINKLGDADACKVSSGSGPGSNGGMSHYAPFTRLIDMAVTNNGVQSKGKMRVTLLSDLEG